MISKAHSYVPHYLVLVVWCKELPLSGDPKSYPPSIVFKTSIILRVLILGLRPTQFNTNGIWPSYWCPIVSKLLKITFLTRRSLKVQLQLQGSQYHIPLWAVVGFLGAEFSKAPKGVKIWLVASEILTHVLAGFGNAPRYSLSAVQVAQLPAWRHRQHHFYTGTIFLVSLCPGDHSTLFPKAPFLDG